MFLESFKPNTNGQRWVRKFNTFMFKNSIYRLKKFFIKNKSGRGLNGWILTRHRKCPITSFFIKFSEVNFYSRILLLISFNNSYKNRLTFFETIDKLGNLYYYRGISGIELGDFIHIFPLNPNWEVYEYLGAKLFFKNLFVGQVFCNIRNFYSNKKIAVSAGVFCSLLNYDEYFYLYKIKLPSGCSKLVNSSNICTIGRVIKEKYNKTVFGKAGNYLKYGFRPTVRGVAMNPVDHPHGGRTKTNSPEKSPWGWITKFSR